MQIAHTENFIANGLVSHNTRWHMDDLAGRLLAGADEGRDRWTLLHLPAFASDDDPLGRAPGEPLWPAKYNDEELDRIRANVGSRVFTALYQGQPVAEQGGLLPIDWWQYYDDPPDSFDQVIASWDCAFKDTSDADFVVGQVWGRRGANCYLLAQTRARMDFPKTVAAVLDLRHRYPQAIATLVEDKANGPAVIAALKHAVPGLIAVNPQGGKVARVNAVAAMVEAGNVHLPRRAPWVPGFVDECAAFPSGKHDDMVDAMSQALARLAASTLPFGWYDEPETESVA